MTERELEGIRIQLSMQSQQTYGRVTVWSLMRHIEAVEWELEGQLKINRQLVDLERERKVEDRKVVLPQGVAAALDYYKDNSTDNETIIRAIADDSVSGPNASTLRKFSMVNFDLLLSAMVNGYTVEQTTKDRIGMKISSMLIAMNIETPIPVDQLAKQLTTMLQDEIAESSKSTI